MRLPQRRNRRCGPRVADANLRGSALVSIAVKLAVAVSLTLAWLLLLEAQPMHAGTPFSARDQLGYDFRTSWSPDGRWIAYGDGAWNGLHLASPDNAETPQRFMRMGYGTWSPHGERLLMAGPDLFDYVVDPVTGRAIALEYLASGFDFSPDGARLVYVRNGFTAGPLVVSAWDGTGKQVIADDASDPEWSSTGEEIAFAHDTSCRATGGIEAVRSDGTSRRSFVSTGEWRGQPRWSPDGSLIAFLSKPVSLCGAPGALARVSVIRPDGTGERVLGDVAMDSRISWSPNGRWVAVMENYDRLTLLGTMGQGPVRFHTLGPSLFSWAPDGEHVAYTRDGVVYIGSTDGSERRLAAGFGPDWSPDGSRLSYLAPPYATEMPFDHCRQQAFVIASDGQGGRALSPCWQQADDRPNVVVGTSGDDFAEAFGGRDRLYGGAGDDTLWGHGGSDRLYGGSGRDYLHGGPSTDRLGARDGVQDRVVCGGGHDIVFADALDDVSPDCEVVRRPTN